MEVTIALAQYPITRFTSFSDWGKHTADWVKEATAQKASILVFPEYGSMELTSLFPDSVQQDLQKQLHELQHLLEDFTLTFKKLAKEHDCIIAAPSFPVLEGDHFVNRTFVFSPESEGYQDKWFMTRFENESWGISSPNKELTIFDSRFGKFGIQICYDIEFPIGAQLLAAEGVQMIFSPSCTETLRGATRVHVGARARALEQQIFTGVSQTVGNAEWSPAVDINYGYGGVYSSADKDLPTDGILSTTEHQSPQWHIETVDLKQNDHIREAGQVFNFRDSTRISMAIEEPHTIKTVTL